MSRSVSAGLILGLAAATVGVWAAPRRTSLVRGRIRSISLESIRQRYKRHRSMYLWIYLEEEIEIEIEIKK